MNQWGIRKRLLVITLLPCLLIALVLGGYFTWQQQQILQNATLERHTQSASQLALQSASIINSQQSQALLQPYLDMRDIRALALLDPQQQVITQVGPNMLPVIGKRIIDKGIHHFATENGIRLKAPIFAQGDTLQTELLGWIEMEFNTQKLAFIQLKSLFSSLTLILLFCLLAAYLTLRASSRVSNPLQQVAATLEQLELGNLDARVQLRDRSELNDLGTGINAMASSLQQAQQELQDSVEQATEDLKQTLEEMEVQNIELNLARRNAIDASHTKSEFLANMSHEIRTPLNGILGFTKLLNKTRLNKRQLEYLTTIESSSTSLLSIINDILDFSKIEAGKLVLDSAPVHLRDLTDEVLTMLAPEAHKKGLELAALVYQDVPFEVLGDQIRIKQVLTNLINNAIKFTAHGSVIVRIMVEEETKNKANLRISITDTGIGMSEEQQKRLFKAFSQAETNTARRFGGTGLGLVISKHIVEHMNGEIGVSSQQGAGSQFWFTGQFEVCNRETESWNDAPWFGKQAYVLCHWDTSRQVLQHQLSNYGLNVRLFDDLNALLEQQQIQPAPLCFVEANDNNDYQAMKDLEHGTELIVLLPNNDAQYSQELSKLSVQHSLVYPIAHTHIGHMLQDMFQTPSHLSFLQQDNSHIRVLAVDDNSPNLELLSTWLNDLQVQVVQATGGQEAVAHGTNEKFDLIFMDIQMPDMDGIEATQLIRANTMNAQTPLVALTAHALPNERKQLLQSGFDDYLSKPISEEQLSHTLVKWTNYKPLNSFAPLPKALPASDNIFPDYLTSAVVDWQQCLSLSGQNASMATTMLQGLIDEAAELLKLITDTSLAESEALEAVHKLHGLSKYVGVGQLRQALEDAETCLKIECEKWPQENEKLQQAIKELINWNEDYPWKSDVSGEVNSNQ